MPWSYCTNCDYELSRPSTREIGDQKQKCPKCGEENDPKISIGDLLEDLEERIEVLEQKVFDSGA